jgi:hypothetical protein
MMPNCSIISIPEAPGRAIRDYAMLARLALAILMLVSMPSAAVRADGVADFYRGRTVNLVVGYGPGVGHG